MEDKLTKEEVDKKIEQLKETIKQHKIKEAIVTYQKNNNSIKEYQNIKQKNRKKNKLQKNSRKKNR